MLFRRVICLLVLLLCLLWGAAAAEAADVDFSALYPDQFLPEGSAPIVTESSYQSSDVNITISTRRVCSSDVYVVDIYVRSLACFQRVHAGGAFGKTTAKVRNLAEESGAILAMTGDSGHYFTKGWSISNGVVNQDSRNRQRDIAILYRSGELVGVDNTNVDNEQLRADADAGNIWHLFLFGPNLLDEEGNARPKKDFEDSNVRYANPRSVIGYYAPGHYCFVQVDGRGTTSAPGGEEKEHRPDPCGACPADGGSRLPGGLQPGRRTVLHAVVRRRGDLHPLQRRTQCGGRGGHPRSAKGRRSG